MPRNTKTLADYAQPTPLSDVDVHFSVAGGPTDKHSLIPPEALIPKEFFERGKTSDAAREWREFQSEWFYKGLDGTEVDLRAKPGVDLRTAMRHLDAIQKSWEPSHELKEASVAFLASLWLEGWRK